MRSAMVAIRTASVCLLCLGVARAEEKLELDQTVPLQRGTADVKLEVGRIVVTRILVRDAPGEEEVQKANEKYHSYVRPVVVMTSTSHKDADVDLELTLQDADGNALLRCSRSVEIEAGDEDSAFDVCIRGRMKTLDWPRVRQVHVVAHVEMD